MDIKACEGKTDEELAGLAKKNSDYFGCLMRRYETRLVLYIRRIIGVNNVDAEDILQEALVKVYYNLNDFDPQLKFSSWVYRITRNQAYDFIRKKQARPVNYFSPEDLAVIAGSGEWRKDNAGHDNEHLAVEALRVLPQKYREVLELKFLEGYDYREISDILQIPVGTVGTLINRAKKKMRAALSQ